MEKFFLSFVCLLVFFASDSAAMESSYEPTHFYLVRNGATPRNVQGLVQGQEEVSDAQLNQEGKDQAEQVGHLLQALHPKLSTKFYSSPLGRALETAKIAASHFDNVRILLKPDLKEIDHGRHDGMDKHLRNTFWTQYYAREIAKFKEQFPDQTIDPYFKWKVNPLAGTETCFSLCQRMIRILNDIGEENPGKEIAVFTHGVPIEALITHLKYQNGEITDEILPLYYEKSCMPNCSVAHFVYYPQAEQEKDRIQFIGFETDYLY